MPKEKRLAFWRQTSHRWRRLVVLVWCGSVGVIGIDYCVGWQSAHASNTSVRPTSSAAARHDATQAIPWKQLAPQERQLVSEVVQQASIYRRMPTRVIDCDPQLFTFLGQHPEVVTEVWQRMGCASLELDRLGADRFRASDKAGTQGEMVVLQSEWSDQAQNRVLVYAEGSYRGVPFPGEIRARSVLLLRSDSVTETNGRPYITARLDSFILLERLDAHVVAKTVSPLLAKTADHNFCETMKFLSNFSNTAEKNPDGMQRLASTLLELSPQTRADMADVCHQAAARYREIAQAKQEEQVRLARRTKQVPR